MFFIQYFSQMIKQFEQLTKFQLMELVQSKISKTKNGDGTFTCEQIIQFADKHFGFGFGRSKIKKVIKKFNISDEKSVAKETVAQIYWSATLSKKQQQNKINKQNKLTSQIIEEYEKKQKFNVCQLQKIHEQFTLDHLRNKSYIKEKQIGKKLSEEDIELILQQFNYRIYLCQFEECFINYFGQNAEISPFTFREFLNTSIYPGYQIILINQIYSYDMKQYEKIDIKIALKIVSKIQELKQGYLILMAPFINLTEESFQKFDKNKNNFIELDQLRQFCNQYIFIMKDLRIRGASQIMAKFDLDRDRKLGRGQTLLGMIQLYRAYKI